MKYKSLLNIVRIIYAIQLIASGLNWWVKISIYPSIVDYTDRVYEPQGLVEFLISTGFMFHGVKAIELVCGILLLFGRFVPIALIVLFPITVSIFIFDVLLVHFWQGPIMGTGTLVEHVFLFLAYYSWYQPMINADAKPDIYGGEYLAAAPGTRVVSTNSNRFILLLNKIMPMAIWVVLLLQAGVYFCFMDGVLAYFTNSY